MSSKRLWVIALVSLVAAPATAEPEPGAPGRRFEVGLFVGGNWFTADNELGNAIYSVPEQVPHSAPLFGLRGGTTVLPDLAPTSALHPRLDVEVEAKLALSSTGSAGGRDSYSSPVVGWRAHARLALWPEHALSPFAVLGLGGETVFSDSPWLQSGDSDAELHWGLGASYRVAPRIDLRADLRHEITAGREDRLASTLELHLGAAFHFEVGRGPRIGKKVIAAEPPPPARPADLDQDGIPDLDDRCPKQPETFNQIDDSDGCPEIDSDGDGLLGSQDGCPDAAEDVDGYQDEDGCPDPDNDGDGHSDAEDQCPAEPETKNGFEDEDGCPDELPPAVARFTGVIAGIQFASGSARITGGSRRTLARAVKTLAEYPTLRLKISGYTDDRGDREANIALSLERADAVKAYLVRMGIDGDRLETEGLGPDQPIADNATAAGRRKNRRIEFTLVPATE